MTQPKNVAIYMRTYVCFCIGMLTSTLLASNFGRGRPYAGHRALTRNGPLHIGATTRYHYAVHSTTI